MGRADDHGCCKSGERWDDNKKECCECSSGDGICCDGCHYRSSSYVCDSNAGTEYSCRDGNCLSNDIFVRYKKRYCSGSSSTCSGSYEYYGEGVDQYCSGSEYCSGSTSWGTSTKTCKTAQCTSGVCCDTTCGVYNYKSTTYICDNTLAKWGCPWGNDLTDDVGKKIGNQYCSGSSSTCSGSTSWGNWNIFDDCISTEYCDGGESPSSKSCTSIACSTNSDCGTDYWYGLKCQNNDVYGDFAEYKCNSPGQKTSYCSNTDIFKKKEDCGNDYCDAWGSNYCKGGHVYHSRTCYDKGCSSETCFSNPSTEEAKVQDCGTAGCSNGNCNQQACTPNSKRCNGNTVETCKSDGTGWTTTQDCGTSSYCLSGTCSSCSSGKANCNQNTADACEINLMNNNTNCGSCGNACPSEQTCQNRQCQSSKFLQQLAISANSGSYYSDNWKTEFATGASDGSCNYWKTNSAWCKSTLFTNQAIELTFDKSVYASSIEVYFTGIFQGDFNIDKVELQKPDGSWEAVWQGTNTRCVLQTSLFFIQRSYLTNKLRITTKSGYWGCIDAVKLEGYTD